MHAGHLTLSELRSVINRIWEARSKWKTIGIELKLEITDLDAISMKHGSDTDACLTEMLTMWLKRTEHRPKWSTMIRALESRPVGFQQLAEDIEKNSLRTKRDKLLKLPLKGVDEESQKRPEFKGRLRAQTRDILFEFNILKCKLFDTLKRYPFKKLAKYLKVLELSAEENLKSFKEVQKFIQNKSSFYDYEIVKCIIRVAGTEEDKQHLQQYEKHFEDYARTEGRVCEVQSPTTSPATPDSQSVSKICIKLNLDSEYDELERNPAKLLQFQCRLCNLLKLPMCVSWSA